MTGSGWAGGPRRQVRASVVIPSDETQLGDRQFPTAPLYDSRLLQVLGGVAVRWWGAAVLKVLHGCEPDILHAVDMVENWETGEVWPGTRSIVLNGGWGSTLPAESGGSHNTVWLNDSKGVGCPPERLHVAKASDSLHRGSRGLPQEIFPTPAGSWHWGFLRGIVVETLPIGLRIAFCQALVGIGIRAEGCSRDGFTLR